MAHPLDGMVVLDLSGDIAGAYCTKTLADGGADVVKLESDEGDPLRRWAEGRQLAEGEIGALFEFLSGSKRSVLVDLRRDDDGALAESLLAAADIVVWTPGSSLSEAEAWTP